MTRAGQNLEKLTGGLPWEVAKPMWQKMSAQFARGASNTANVFINTAKYSNGSIWRTLEAPILQSRGVGFRYHYIYP
ncbi:MAG: hypothetical protein E2600_10065 [Chryseobacterium sp.]|nr:hypothetical protein [Chryseobacterium sp.]